MKQEIGEITKGKAIKVYKNYNEELDERSGRQNRKQFNSNGIKALKTRAFIGI